jgi:hypothetical protein
MRRVLRFWWRPESQPVPTWSLSAEQRRELLSLLSELGLGIVHDARGPVPLMTFGRAVLERLHPSSQSRVPLPAFADALKHVIREMEHEQLRVMSPTTMVGVGYVFNAADPNTWPVKSSLR